MGQEINKDLMKLWMWELINTQRIQVRVCLPSYAQVNLSPIKTIKDRTKRIGLEMLQLSPSLVFAEDLEYKKKKKTRPKGTQGQSKIRVQNECWKALSLGDKSNPGEELKPEVCFCLKVTDHLLWKDGTSQNK